MEDHAVDPIKALERARLGSIIGMGAVACALMMMCGGCVMAPLSVILALTAIYLGREALAVSDDPLIQAHGRHALGNGVMVALWGSALTAFFAAYILLYVGLFAFLVAVEGL